MINLYEKNALVFRSEEEIQTRNYFVWYIKQELQNYLKSINRAFEFFQCEATTLTPRELINPNYTDDDLWVTADNLVMRPETTMGSYEYAKHLLNPHNTRKVSTPLVVRQHGKSYRQEQDKVTKNMRLKEFYQLEFQIIYQKPSDVDHYYKKIVPFINELLGKLLGQETYVIPSDRLPDYSNITTDIQMRWNDMEICSISQRKDFVFWDKEYLVTEVAIWTDRLLYNFDNWMYIS